MLVETVVAQNLDQCQVSSKKYRSLMISISILYIVWTGNILFLDICNDIKIAVFMFWMYSISSGALNI